MEKEIYELKIDDLDLSPVSVISLVGAPAIESNLVLFCSDCKDKQYIKFKYDQLKGQIVSAILIPDKLIYRFDNQKKKEYYVYVSEETIEELAKKFLTFVDKRKAFSVQHNGKLIDGIEMIESWIIETENDKANSLYGLNLPKGSWVGRFDVKNNKQVFEDIIKGNINGLSIEADFVFEKKQKFAIEPKEGETKDEFVSRCIATEIDNGYPQDQAAAICYSKWEEEYFNQMEKEMIEMDKQLGKEFFAKTYLLESYSNYPLAVSDNAKKAIERNEANGNRCGTLVSRKIAQQLRNRQPISYITIRRMFSYLSRNFNLYKENEVNSCNNISFNLLGGNKALRWSERIIRQVEDNIKNERE